MTTNERNTVNHAPNPDTYRNGGTIADCGNCGATIMWAAVPGEDDTAAWRGGSPTTSLTCATTKRGRTDSHSPSNFDPAEYIEIGSFDNHYEDGYCSIDDGYHDKVPFSGNYERRGRCDHCGAGPLRYGGIFYNARTDETIVVGLTCASRLSMTSRTTYEMAKIAKANREARERREAQEAFEVTLTWEQREAIATAEQATSYPLMNEDGTPSDYKVKFPAYRGDTSAFASDIVSKLHRYGSLSEKQIGALVKIKTRNDDYVARNESEAAKLAEAPALAEGRYEITGEVVSIKSGENDFGYWVKMLVKMADGNKVYGTIPSSINPDKGDTVTFTARVERSRDDEHFGFFSRPTKASVAGRQEVTA